MRFYVKVRFAIAFFEGLLISHFHAVTHTFTLNETSGERDTSSDAQVIINYCSLTVNRLHKFTGFSGVNGGILIHSEKISQEYQLGFAVDRRGQQ